MSGREEIRTPGCRRDPEGECLFDLATIESILAGPDCAGRDGVARDDDRRMVALMRMPAGAVAEAHTHPHQQWIFVLEGWLHADVGGTDIVAGPGSLVHVPAGIVHSCRAGGDCDLVFFIAREAIHGRAGTRAA